MPVAAAGSNGEVFLAFGRVFSGVVRDGMTVRWIIIIMWEM